MTRVITLRFFFFSRIVLLCCWGFLEAVRVLLHRGWRLSLLFDPFENSCPSLKSSYRQNPFFSLILSFDLPPLNRCFPAIPCEVILSHLPFIDPLRQTYPLSSYYEIVSSLTSPSWRCSEPGSFSPFLFFSSLYSATFFSLPDPSKRWIFGEVPD